MLHGHIHSDMSYNISNREAGIKRYDVGVDANDYMPVSIKQIEDFLNSKEQFDEEKS
jgi:calcineurin-like phosphoesterase family protein